jgi:hypothetical protein
VISVIGALARNTVFQHRVGALMRLRPEQEVRVRGQGEGPGGQAKCAMGSEDRVGGCS